MSQSNVNPNAPQTDAAFRLLVESVVDYAIFMLDPRGNIATWNPGAERIKGYRADEIIGRHFSQFYPEQDVLSGKPARELETASREGRVEDEGWRVRKDGSRFWASVVITALRDPHGRLVGFAKVTRDLTERRRAEQQRLELGMNAARMLEGISDLFIALANARTTAEVAAVVVDQSVGLAAADICFLYLLDETGDALELVGHRGVAPEIVEEARRLTVSSGPETFAALRAGVSLWAETAADYARLFPRVANLKATGRRARAFWCVPLVGEGRAIGLFGVGFYEERRFTHEQRSLAETLAKQCAQALLRARRLESEERTRAWITTTLRSIGDGVIATDPAGRVTIMNSIAERLTGWNEAEGRGKPLEDVFCILSEQTRTKVESPVAKVLREGVVVGLANHTLLVSKGGEEIPVDDSAAPIRDAHGALFGVVLVFRDATSEREVHRRRNFLARAGAVLASSLDYRATLTNVARLAVPQLADWCAVDVLEVGSPAPQQLAVAHVDPEKAEWARELGKKYRPDPNAQRGAANVIRTGTPELYPELSPSFVEANARDEEHRRILRELKLESAMVVPLRGRERTLGAVTFVYAGSGRRYAERDFAFAQEFADRAGLAVENAWAMKAAEEARAEERRLRSEADVANRAKDEFLATVSHELRTPLSAIVGWTATLRARKPPPEIDHALAIIERSTQRQARLIDDVLDVSRIISGKMSLTPGPTNIAAVVDGAIEAVSAAATGKEITLKVDVDRALMISADGDRLQQVVWNLVTNAVKFSLKGGTVLVRAARDGSDACITVDDNGEGISPEVLPHIFEPFRQADASTTRRHGGLGLGLAIVKQLVTAHGGTVTATSEGVGQGSRFAVRLPARSAVMALTDMPRSPEVARPPSIPDPRVAPRLDGLSVLVVDDEEDARGILEQVLRDQGAGVISAESAFQALERFAAAKADVIVSDIGMPDMDGYMLLRRIRGLPAEQGGRTPALALTAYAGKEDAERAFAAGFQMHASKPIEPARLVTLVANLGGRTIG